MEMVEFLRAVFGVILVIFLPGYTLVQATFPRKGELDSEFDTMYRITLGVAMSICIVILTGFILGNPKLGTVPGSDMGFFQAKYITACLLLFSLIFFVYGWYRGAYPWLAMIHPELARSAPGIKFEAEKAIENKHILSELIEMHGREYDRQKIKEQIKEIEQKEDMGDERAKKYYNKQKNRLIEELSGVNSRLAELEKQIADREEKET